MKRLIAALIVLTMLVSSCAFASIIGKGVPNHIAYKGFAKISKHVDRANVRNAKGEVIGQVKHGERVYVIQKDWKKFEGGGEFARIYWYGEEAYIYATNFAAYDPYR